MPIKAAFTYEPATSPCETSQVHRILYVDDDEWVRSLCATILRRAGYHVDTAEDGEAGWEAFQLGNYDLLITDHEMPRLSGVELVQRLRSVGEALPVVIASGRFHAEEGQQDPWLRLAATLRKPFTPAELLRTVEQVLRAAGDPARRATFPMLTEAC
jgi:DNA-binding response OmpR family regulator